MNKALQWITGVLAMLTAFGAWALIEGQLELGIDGECDAPVEATSRASRAVSAPDASSIQRRARIAGEYTQN